jgi:hypothetical protein
MNEELLIRLTEALEGINSSLEEISFSLSGLSECISDGQEGRRLCVTGDIAAYNVN